MKENTIKKVDQAQREILKSEKNTLNKLLLNIHETFSLDLDWIDNLMEEDISFKKKKLAHYRLILKLENQRRFRSNFVYPLGYNSGKLENNVNIIDTYKEFYDYTEINRITQKTILGNASVHFEDYWSITKFKIDQYLHGGQKIVLLEKLILALDEEIKNPRWICPTTSNEIEKELEPLLREYERFEKIIAQENWLGYLETYRAEIKTAFSEIKNRERFLRDKVISKLAWDLRQKFRVIFQFIFKNLDDEGSIKNNIRLFRKWKIIFYRKHLYNEQIISNYFIAKYNKSWPEYSRGD